MVHLSTNFARTQLSKPCGGWQIAKEVEDDGCVGVLEDARVEIGQITGGRNEQHSRDFPGCSWCADMTDSCKKWARLNSKQAERQPVQRFVHGPVCLVVEPLRVASISALQTSSPSLGCRHFQVTCCSLLKEGKPKSQRTILHICPGQGCKSKSARDQPLPVFVCMEP